MYPNSKTLQGIVSVLCPRDSQKDTAQPNLPRRHHDERTSVPACRTQLPTLDELNADVLRLIALQLPGSSLRDFGSLKEFASCSRALRQVASPILFYCCHRRNPEYRYPPEAIRPFIRHLKYTGRFDDDESRETFETLLDYLVSVTTLTFRSPRSVPWDVIKSCSNRPRITSLTFRPGAGFTRADRQYPVEDPECPAICLTSFSYVQVLWREIQGSNLRTMGRTKDLSPRFAREAAALSALVPKLHSTVEQLILPMETSPLLDMAALPWPHLRELTIYGRYLSGAQVESLPVLLSSLRELQSLAIRICRHSTIGRAPILGHHSSPSSVLSGLCSLIVAYPDPDDDILSVNTDSLRHLSLTDWPRYYNHIGYGAHYGQRWSSPILSPAECLSVLRRMDLPELSSLELVYLADGAGSDDDLLQYIVSAFPKLAHLELHRYRTDRKEEVDHTHIARILASARALRTLRLNLDFRGDHGPYCGDYAVRKKWWDTFKGTLGWEIVDIVQDCPLLGCVEILYHGAPTATWVEFHPQRCAEPRFVLSYDDDHRDSELMPYTWFEIFSTGPWSGDPEWELTPPPEDPPQDPDSRAMTD
ncbi:hypothetical protein K466DRAFT_530188 [Polyporus arcularius HHB13444]|uniref:Uncharacterized protein n=1 Tax=Polyporus arcularius HHB13444 TaxID=1314778 RepID=A0A5C3NZ07_9APHY|nr:hypothetical protein K466DRAFT_530188 [Polyporus arcularius HHB13444]